MIETFIEQIKQKNYAFEKVTDKLIWVKNYLTEIQLNTIFEIINSVEQKDWEIEYMGNLSRFCMEKFGRSDVDNLVAEGKFEITQNWIDKNYNICNYPIYREVHGELDAMIQLCDSSLELSGLATIQRMQSGVELKSHVDQHTDPSIRYATIIYLNNDYNEGELFFKKLGMSLRPNPGDLLFFPGDEEHEHGVKHVADGPIRYVIVGFIKEKDFYLNNKY